MLQPVGELHLDDGACRAIRDRGASLLQVGLTGIRGEFEANQPVTLRDPEGNELGRGLCSRTSHELQQALQASVRDGASPVVVHRDVLVLSDQYRS